MNKLLGTTIIILVIVCGYQYSLLAATNDRLNIVNGIAKDAMAASLQQSLISVELLKTKEKEFVIEFLSEQASTEYRNVINYPYTPQNGDTFMVKKALENYLRHFSGGTSEKSL